MSGVSTPVTMPAWRSTSRSLRVWVPVASWGLSAGRNWWTATGLPPNQAGFGPLLPDVVQVPYDDPGALDRLPAEAAGRVAAVIAEPVVGTGFTNPDFELIGRAFGYPVTRIRTQDQLMGLGDILRRSGPAFIVVDTSLQAILPKPRG